MMKGLSLSVALLCAASSAGAQNGQIDLPSIPAGTVLVLNGGNKTIVFYVSPDKVNLRRFALESGGRQLIQVGDSSQVFGTVKTGTVRVDRILEPKKRYRLSLDGQRKVWDFVEIRPR